MTDSDTAEISSLLSKKQRRWLQGDDDALGSPDRVIRSRIKERVRQGIIDMGIVERSERFSNEDSMKIVRSEESSSADKGVQKFLATERDMDEEIQPYAMDAAVAQLEMASGTEIGDFNMSELTSLIKQVKGQYGTLPEKLVRTLVVAAALSALEGTGKTDKQIRQWVEHRWPDEEEVFELWEDAEEYLE